MGYMSPSDIEEFFQKNPEQPMRLTLSSGDQVIVQYPDRVTFYGLELHFSTNFVPGSRIGRHLRIVSIPNIALIEPLDTRRNNGGRRRRR
jgi:hypothetical protein